MRVRSRNCHDQPGGTISRRVFLSANSWKLPARKVRPHYLFRPYLFQLTLNDRANSRLTLQIRIAEFVSTTKSEQEHAWSGN
jgi:hypothetical protein